MEVIKFGAWHVYKDTATNKSYGIRELPNKTCILYTESGAKFVKNLSDARRVIEGSNFGGVSAFFKKYYEMATRHGSEGARA